MKNKIQLTTLLLCIVSVTSLAQPNFQTDYFRDGMYFFDGIEKYEESELFTTYLSQFGLGSDYTLVQKNNVVEEDGKSFSKYELYYKGVPVEGSMMNLRGDKGLVLSANGFLLKNLDIDITGLISESTAITNAIDYINATLYPWQDSTMEANLKEATEDDEATSYPTATLLITKKRGEYAHVDSNYQLCYLVKIDALDPQSGTDVYIDAKSGDVYTEQESAEHGFKAPSGSVWTWYNGYQTNLETTGYNIVLGSTFKLKDITRNIFTRNNVDGQLTDENNNWIEDGNYLERLRKTGAAAQWSVQRAYDYYLNKHSRWGSNYLGMGVHISTGVNRTQISAEYQRGTFGSDVVDKIIISNNDDAIHHPDQYNSGVGYSIVALDILSHEYTHAMIQESSKLGALQDLDAQSIAEGFCDIFGEVVENYTFGSNDWEIGANTGFVLRHFEDPYNDYGINASLTGASSRTYLDQQEWSPQSEYGNSGVLRKWFYMLVNGDTYNNQVVQSIGMTDATEIAYWSFNWYLWSNVNYPDAAQQIAHAAAAKFGHCSKQHINTIKSLRAVGFTNVLQPLCKPAGMIGPDVLMQTTQQGGSFEVKPLSDGSEIGSPPIVSLIWTIPEGWTAVIEGTVATITSVDNYASQIISATYIDSLGHTDSVSKIVHFSDVEWSQTNNAPADKKGIIETEESENSLINIYPNPLTDILNIEIAKNTELVKIEILDLSGKLIIQDEMKAETKQISLSNLQNGLYILRLLDGQHIITRKISIIK